MVGEWRATINPGVQTLQEDVSVDLFPGMLVSYNFEYFVGMSALCLASW